MHSLNIAEGLLCLVTTRERAASTIGDLTERAATRGRIWFWSGVVRTAASLLCRNLAEQPVRFAGLALLALAVYIGIDLVFAVLSGAAFYWNVMPGWRPLHLDSMGWRIWFNLPALLGSVLVGRMLARWAPGRELAACVAYSILAAIYNLVPILGDNGAFTALLCILIVPAGAMWGRTRRLRAA